MIKSSVQRSTFLIYIALVLLTFVAFEQVLQNDFVNYDDPSYVTENPHVKNGITEKSIIWAFTESHFFMWHPMTSLSHMLDCTIFGLNPAGHHLTNLILHTASALLLFSILKKMTGGIWPSAFVAAVFALHPLNVESVAWVAERKNVLSGFFWMLTIAAYIRYTRRPHIAGYLIVVLVFSVALMSKPTMVTLPFVLLLLDYWPLQRFQLKQQSKVQALPQLELPENSYQKQTILRLLAEKIPLLILSAILCVITVVAERGSGSLKGTEILPLGIRAANASVSYVSYIVKIIHPNHLAVFYPHPGFNLPAWKPVVSLVVLVVVSAGIIYFGLRRPYLIVGWLWYLGTLVPVIGIVLQAGGQAMADRYTYLPAIGLFIIVSLGFTELSAGRCYRKIVLGVLAALLLAAMLIYTRIQVHYWKNSLTLAGHALEVTENNGIMHNSYGCALFENGQLEQAAVHFKHALEINPHNPLARGNLGKILLKQGKFREAIENLTIALESSGGQPDIYDSLGQAYSQLGQFDLAAQNYEKALQIDPQNLHARNSMGKALLAQGKFKQAVACFEEALRVRKDWPDVYANLGLAYAQLGQSDLAVRHLTEAARLKSDDADVLNNLAWILATTKNDKLRNPGDAVKFAGKACELTGFKQPEVIDTLAAAYAAAGDFQEAIKNAERAVTLASSGGQKDLAAKIQKQLELYKTETAYRE